MNLATATVTVYFVGLMTFYAPPGSNTVKREVIVPLATSTATKHADLTLRPHDAYIVFRGLTGKDTACSSLKGEWDGEDDCKVGPFRSGKRVTLPTSKWTFDPSTMRPAPKITSQCKDVQLDRTYLTDDSKYAVRLSVTNGSLSSCTSERALVQRITLPESSGELTIDGKCEADLGITCPVTVKLDHEAAVFIINEPTGPVEKPVDERKHFYWNYKMYLPPAGTTCTDFPNVAWVGGDCPTKMPHTGMHGLLTQSGTSCTPTGWP